MATGEAGPLPDGVKELPSPKEHVGMWLLGVVAASLIPFLFIAVHGMDGDHLPGFVAILGRGDLLVVSIVVAVGSVADLALVWTMLDKKKGSAAAFTVVGSLLIVVGEAVWYSDVSTTLLSGGTVQNEQFVCYGSLILFIVTLFCSGRCVHLSAGVR